MPYGFRPYSTNLELRVYMYGCTLHNMYVVVELSLFQDRNL